MRSLRLGQRGPPVSPELLAGLNENIESLLEDYYEGGECEFHPWTLVSTEDEGRILLAGHCIEHVRNLGAKLSVLCLTHPQEVAVVALVKVLASSFCPSQTQMLLLLFTPRLKSRGINGGQI